MTVSKDVYLVVKASEKIHAVFQKNLMNRMEKSYGMLEVSKMFYYECKGEYPENKIFIIVIPRIIQKTVEKAIEDWKNHRILFKGGVLKKTQERLVKYLKQKNDERGTNDSRSEECEPQE